MSDTEITDDICGRQMAEFVNETESFVKHRCKLEFGHSGPHECEDCETKW